MHYLVAKARTAYVADLARKAIYMVCRSSFIAFF